jgi:predicted Rossmann fold flavoprotein
MRAALVFAGRIPYKRGMSQPSSPSANPEAAKADADLLVLGAGPAGLLCALAAARRMAGAKARVALVHRGAKPAPKLLASGGGRCNCTNAGASPAHYLSRQPRFTAQALKRFGPDDFLALLAGLGLRAHEEDHGRYFCDQGAATLTEALVRACREAGCRFFAGREISCLAAPPRPGDLFRTETDKGPLRAPNVVIALGSPAWPALGGTDATARLAGQLGLAHIPARPALTPFLLAGQDAALCRELSGLSVAACVSLVREGGAPAYEDGLLFTHQGLSGPAALQISSHWRRGEALRIDLAPGTDVPALLRDPARGRALARTVLGELAPRRLAEARLAGLPHALAEKRLAECSRAELKLLAECFTDWRLTPKGTAGMARAEAASGGLDTAEFSAKTMECRTIPGLYAVGEALDVAGELGGFNLQWAWSSGHCAGEAAGRRLFSAR